MEKVKSIKENNFTLERKNRSCDIVKNSPQNKKSDVYKCINEMRVYCRNTIDLSIETFVGIEIVAYIYQVNRGV